jgi:hypothetical protein
MPLSRPARRAKLHTRDIVINGYEREDGLVDIEARITDTKTYSFGNFDRGGINAGEALHDMWLRLSIDREMLIITAEAAMDSTPHSICPGAAPNFARLEGLTIGRGFLKLASIRLGGVEGCTHLRELLQQIGTTAIQTMMSVKRLDRPVNEDPSRRRVSRSLVNSCYAYDEAKSLVGGDGG